MCKNIQSICYISVLTVALNCCQADYNSKTANKQNKIKTITEVIHSSIGWAKNKDLKLLYNSIADDSLYLEVHPNNRVVRGIQDFRKTEAFWMNPEFKAIRYEIKDLVINLSNSGDVAWWYCVLDDINEWKGQPASWENTRWTGVLEKRNDKWVIVQMHFSFAHE